MKTAVVLSLFALVVAPAASANSLMLFGWGTKPEQLTCAFYNTPAGSGKQAVANVSTKIDKAGRASASAKLDMLNNGSLFMKGAKALMVVTTSDGKRYLTAKYTNPKNKLLYKATKTFIRPGVWTIVEYQASSLNVLRTQCLIENVK